MTKATAPVREMIQNPLQAQNISEPKHKGNSSCSPLASYRDFAAVGTLVVLGGFSLPARADDLAQNLGPVGPHEPILTTVGSKRVIAFYEPGDGNCDLQLVVWNRTDESGVSAARVRVSLNARQMAHIDSADNESLDLQCGDDAETLKIVDTSKMITAGAAQ